MSNEQEPIDGLPDGPYATVEAFIDGELVSPEALKSALADPASRDHLVDLLVLREAVRTMVSTPYPMAERPTMLPNRLPWLAAAAAVVISLIGGYVAGQRVVAPVAAQSVQAAVHAPNAPAAPKPTRVITLRPGVDWIENSKGQ